MELFQSDYILGRVIRKAMAICNCEPGRKFLEQSVQARSRFLVQSQDLVVRGFELSWA